MYRCGLIAVVLTIAGATGATAQRPLSQADSAGIRKTLSAMTSAGMTGHYREVGRYFTEDGVWMPQEEPAVEGRGRVQAWFTVGAKDWQHRILEVEGAGNLAYVRATYSGHARCPAGRPDDGKGSHDNAAPNGRIVAHRSLCVQLRHQMLRSSGT